jgi:hypothetical protein
VHDQRAMLALVTKVYATQHSPNACMRFCAAVQHWLRTRSCQTACILPSFTKACNQALQHPLRACHMGCGIPLQIHMSVLQHGNISQAHSSQLRGLQINTQHRSNAAKGSENLVVTRMLFDGPCRMTVNKSRPEALQHAQRVLQQASYPVISRG